MCLPLKSTTENQINKQGRKEATQATNQPTNDQPNEGRMFLDKARGLEPNGASASAWPKSVLCASLQSSRLVLQRTNKANEQTNKHKKQTGL